MLAATRGLDKLCACGGTPQKRRRRRFDSPGGGGTPCPSDGWHASPHGGTGTLRTAASAAHLDRLAGMPRLAQHALPGGGGTPCPAAHASHGSGAMSTEQAELNDYDPTYIYL